MAKKQRKRGPNEGNIRQRPDGRWEARLSLGYKDGKRGRVSYYGDTYREVEQQLTKAKRERHIGTFVSPDRQTVKEFLSDWLTTCAEPRLRPRTFQGYKHHVDKNIVPVLGHVTVQKLTAQQVQALINEKAKTLAPRTVKYVRAVLRTALNQALKWDLIPKNPALGVNLPRAPRHQFHVLTPEEAKTLIVAAKGHRLGPLFTVAMSLGLRIGEALGLKWDDIDSKAKTLRVERALQRIKGRGLQFVEPKSETSRRSINLPEFAIDAMNRHRTAQKRERLIAGADWKDTGLVFTTPTGTPLDGSNVWKVFKQLLTAAKLPDMRVHDLRHTFATLLLAQGVPAKLVQETLGHSQISLTLDTYSHVLPTMKQEVADKIDEALAGGQ